MKLVLNTAIDPHFCAILDANNVVLKKKKWENRSRDGQEIWNFLNENRAQQIKFEMIGGVSGPGGFSSLRTSAGILNAIAFSQKTEIKQVRADLFVAAFLKSHGREENFVLNSFGKAVFVQDGDKLQHLKIDEAVAKFKDEKVFVGVLPEEKAILFSNKIDLKFENTESLLGEVLSTQKSQKTFIPDYEFDPV